MFHVTPSAAATLANARTERGLPRHFGVRIAPSDSQNGHGPAYQLSFAAEPADGDLVRDTDLARVFVAPEAAEPLNDTVLDAEDTDQGTKLVLKRR
jgi:Fe-S cluster assembly iron-binding protein IscA